MTRARIDELAQQVIEEYDLNEDQSTVIRKCLRWFRLDVNDDGMTK